MKNLFKNLKNLFETPKSEKPIKHKKQKYFFSCKVKGSFLEERERVLIKIYRENSPKERTGDLRETIDLSLPYNTYLSVCKDKEYYKAELDINQKR